MVRNFILFLVLVAVGPCVSPDAAASDADLDRDLITFGEYSAAPTEPVTQTAPVERQFPPPPGGLDDLVPVAPDAPHTAQRSGEAALDDLIVLVTPPPETAAPARTATIAVLDDLVDLMDPPASPVPSPAAAPAPDAVVLAGPVDAGESPEFINPFRPRDVSRLDAPPRLPVLEPSAPPVFPTAPRTGLDADVAAALASLPSIDDAPAISAGPPVPVESEATATAPAPLPPPPELAPAPRGDAGVALDQLQDLVLADSGAMHADDDLVTLAPLPALPSPAIEPEPPEIPAGPPRVPGADFAQAQAAFGRIEAHCLAGETGLARTEYDALPAFGADGTVNRLRSDAANLLVLNYALDGDLDAARAIFDAMPAAIPGEGAMLGKYRAVINLATFYVRQDRLDDGFAMFEAIPASGPGRELYPEAFRLAARMIPYLDNAGDADKAEAVFDRMLKLAKQPGALPQYCRNVPGLTHYLLGRPSVVVSTPEQERRLALMERVFGAFDQLPQTRETERLRRDTAEAMEHFYRVTGNTPKAAEMRQILASRGASGQEAGARERLE